MIAKYSKYIFENIINTGIYQIINSKNTTVESFISELFIQQRKNIEICIKIDRIEWFKKYINKINILFKEYPENENNILDEIYHLNIKIGKDSPEVYFKKAFENCHNLSSFILPNSVNLLSLSAFENCYNLSKFLTPAFFAV